MTQGFPISAAIPKTAVALRPMRLTAADVPIHYSAHTFPNGAYRGCELTIRRLECFGHLPSPSAAGLLVGSLFVDILDQEGDIIDTLAVTRRGFEYLRRVLKFRRESA